MTEPKQIPILFNTAMMRAILDGQKTQTRRPVQTRKGLPLPRGSDYSKFTNTFSAAGLDYRNPFGKPGDLLWCRETFTVNRQGAIYRADYIGSGVEKYADVDNKWTPSIHMPKAACRQWLRVKRVWVERVEDISETDAIAEGMKPEQERGRHPTAGAWVSAGSSHKIGFLNAWEQIYGARAGWGWCCEFERCEAPGE